MLVLCVSRSDGFTSTNLLADEAAAEAAWAALVDKACDCAEAKRQTVRLHLYEVSADSAAAVSQALDRGEAARIKGVCIRPPKSLLHKVKTSGPGVVTDAVLDRSQQVIDRMAADYPALARADLAALQLIANRLGEPELSEDDHAALMGQLYQLTYKMKGQGGTFGYPAMTAIAHHLYVMARAATLSHQQLPEAVQVHIDAMQLVMKRNLSGNSPEGKSILEGLHAVIVKIVGAAELE